MEAEHKADKRTFAVILFIILLKLARTLLRAHHCAAHNAAKTHFFARLHEAVTHKIHIKSRRAAACQIFKHRQLCKVVDALARQLCLHRKYLFCQPILQRHIVSIRAQEGHRRVCVRVFKAGHQHIAVQVDLALKSCVFKLLRIRLAYKCDLVRICPDLNITQLAAALHSKHFSAVKPYHKATPFGDKILCFYKSVPAINQNLV